MKVDGDLTKLPVWARRHIDTLEMRYREVLTELNALKANEPTRVMVEPHASMLGDGKEPTYLNERSIVRFLFGERQYVDVRLDGDRLDVHSDSTLRIVPSASNHVYVGRQER